jgi:chromate transporter
VTPRPGAGADSERVAARVPLRTIAVQWGRIGCIGFGGPPAHIALLRKLCVERRGWLAAEEFEDGVAAANLLPGPASTQLAIFCAWRLAGPLGAIVGGVCFIVPGLVIILALAALFLAARPPLWIAGAAAGAGAAVPAVAAAAAMGLAPASWRRASPPRARAASGGGTPPAAPQPAPSGVSWLWSARWRQLISRSRPQPSHPQPSQPHVTWPRLAWPHARWLAYLLVGGAVGALAGQFLVLALLACGLIEMASRTARAGSSRYVKKGDSGGSGLVGPMLPLVLAGSAGAGGLLALAWVALKVGALSYGGGFVIVPLMQHDAVHTYHWMTGAQFLSAVALGQVTPGPVVLTVAVVGFAAAGIGGGLLATLIAFAPSFAFVLAGAPRFAMLRQNARVQAFLTGAGPAAIGAIAGATISLALDLVHLWQVAVLGLAAVWLLGLRRNVVVAIVGAAGLGIIAVLAGAPLA